MDVALSTGVAGRPSLPCRAFALASTVLRLHGPIAALGPPQAHIADQLFRSAASVVANLEEGQASASRRDMAAKYSIALREAREAFYWLRLLTDAGALPTALRPVTAEANEMVAMLTVAVRKLRSPAGN